jgi:hypothetical protein
MQAPTLAPAPIPVTLTILSKHQSSGTSQIVNAATDLQLYGAGASSPSSVYQWSTPNASLLPVSSCLSSVGPYLSVAAQCLSAGSTYVLRMTLTGGDSTQVSASRLPHISPLQMALEGAIRSLNR